MKSYKPSGRRAANHQSSKPTNVSGRRRRTGFRARRLLLEPLEDRRLLAILAEGLDFWGPQGPSPTINAQVESIPSTGPGPNPVSGAVHTVLADPGDADVMYLGATNGGVWRTTDATAVSPTWTPLTDEFPSLSIGAMEFDVTDATNQTILVGIGHASSWSTIGGALTGLLRTTDGGTTWTQLGQSDLGGRNISGVAIRGDEIVVAANGFGGGVGAGVYRSDNGGASFTLVPTTAGLSAGAAFDLVGDPTDANRLYASVQGVGLFRTDDLGISWDNISSGDAAVTTAFTGGGNNNAEMSVASNGRVYLGVVANGQPNYLGFTDDPTAATPTWVEMDLPITQEGDGDFEGLSPRSKPGGQGAIHFSILADPNISTTVYVGGDRQDSPFTNAIGSNAFSGRLFRGDTTIAPVAPGSTTNTLSPQWEHLTNVQNMGFVGGGTASNSSPHADSREMVFDANGNLIETDDGGIYRRTSPTDNTGDWFSLIGSLQNAEFHDIAYDSNSDIIIGGAQDTGTPQQTSTGSFTWDSVTQADGGDVAVDTLIGGGNSLRYSSTQNFTTSFRYEIYDATNTQQGATVAPALTVGGGGAAITNQFATPMITNTKAANRLILGGGNSTYESFDRGENLTEIAPGLVINAPTGGGDRDGIPAVYGGRLNGVDDPEILYVGSNNQVFLRTTAGGALNPTSALPGGATNVQGLAVDPENWMTVYAVDADQVFRSFDAGGTWEEVTGNINDFLLRTVDVVSGPAGVDAVLVGGANGVYRMLTNNDQVWTEYGAGLPNAPVADMTFDTVDNLLLAGTLGRGAWTVDSPVNLFTPSVLTICGDDDHVNQDDQIRLVRNAANSALLDVFINNITVTPDFQMPLGLFQQINVFGVGGNDELIVDTSNGLITVPTGIRYNGDGACSFGNPPVTAFDRGFDRLTVTTTDTGTVFDSEAVAVGQLPGSGRHSVTDFVAGDQTIWFEELEPITTVISAASFRIHSIPELASILQEANTINLEGVAEAVLASGSVDDDGAPSPTTTTFEGDIGLSAQDDFYNGVEVRFTSGALAGEVQTVADYTGADRLFVFASGFSVAPSDGDAFDIVVNAARVTVDNFEPISFHGKQSLRIDAGASDDQVFGALEMQPFQLEDIEVYGDDGHDAITFVDVPDASSTTFVSVEIHGGRGDDVADARAVGQNTPFLLFGDAGNDLLVGGRGDDGLAGGEGDDTLIGGDPAITGNIGSNIYIGGDDTFDADDGFDTLVVLGTRRDDEIDLFQLAPTGVMDSHYAFTSTVNGNTDSITVIQNTSGMPGQAPIVPTIEEIRIEARAGDDLIRVGFADSYVDDSSTNGVPSQTVRLHVIGDSPNASDRLLVRDDGTGDLALVRQAPDERSGTVSLAPAHASGAPAPIVYEAIERLDVIPVNPVTGGTGDDGMGQIVVFQPDPFELNDNRLIPTDAGDLLKTHRDPNIDPGADQLGAPGDEDWYEFRAAKIGTFRFEVLFDEIATVPSGRAGLPGNGDLDIAIYAADGTLLANGVAITGGKSVTFSAATANRYLLRVKGAALANTSSPAINTYDVNLAEIDLGGAQVDGVEVTGSLYDLFDPKPSTDGPTPPITSLTVTVTDPPPRAPGDLYPALDPTIAENPGHYLLVGDHNGIIPIAGIVVTNETPVVGEVPTATIELLFDEPLPDDRFTLTLSDGIRDPAGNRLDGESNASQPLEMPAFPSGDGISGGDFVARFTVDTRAELGVWAAGSVYVDTNGNFGADPENKDNDDTNEDITYVLGFTSDNVFAGNFAADVGDTADRFDKLAAYGRVAGAFRWLIDTDNNGVPNLVVADPLAINGLPIAGNFDGSATNGDEVGLKNGVNWHLDTSHNFNVDTTLVGNMQGFPIVGDFDGDGIDDLGSWTDDTFSLDLSTQLTGAAAAGSYDANINGITDVQFNFGFPGVRERPIAADFDTDGVDDIGLWAPDRSGAVPAETAEWYIFISGGTPIPNRIVANPQANGGNIVDFVPVPFGNDLYAQFGDDFALPVVGNFDPPVVGENSPALRFASFTNPGEPADVNNDGIVTPSDALRIINVLNRGEGGAVTPFRSEAHETGPYFDSNGDGSITPLDALRVINRLNATTSGEGEGLLVAPPQEVATSTAGSLSSLVFAAQAANLPGALRGESVLNQEPGKHRQPTLPTKGSVDALFAQQEDASPRRAADVSTDDDGQLDRLLDEVVDDVITQWWNS